MELKQLHRMLQDWAQYKISETADPVGIGYPSDSPGMLHGKPPTRTIAEQKHHDRMSLLARRSVHYREHDGKQERVIDMVPPANPKQTKARQGASPRYEPWPAALMDLDRMIQMLPVEERSLIAAKYLYGYTRQQTCEELKISDRVYRDCWAKAQGALRTWMQLLAA